MILTSKEARTLLEIERKNTTDDRWIEHCISVGDSAGRIAKALEENIECLIKVKNRFHYLGYFEDERAIGTKIEYLKLQNTTLKKYIPIENDKDNAI